MFWHILFCVNFTCLIINLIEVNKSNSKQAMLLTILGAIMIGLSWSNI